LQLETILKVFFLTTRCLQLAHKQNINPREIPPTHPGEMLREGFMPDYNLTTTGLAQKLGVSRQTVNELLLERRAVSPAMALRLSRLFGNTPEFWLNAQRAVDLWNAKRENKQEIEKISPLQAA
jgi:addiction module HigA family antidote